MEKSAMMHARRWAEPARRLVMATALLSLSVADTAAQRARLPEEATALLVRVHGHFATRTDGAIVRAVELGSGVIIGIDTGAMWVATAKHVVRRGRDQSDVWAFLPFSSNDSARATIVGATEPDTLGRDLDIALLRLPIRRSERADVEAALDRLGKPRGIQPGDPVFPLGCPQDVCGVAPSPPDRVVSNDGKLIAFYSSIVAPGSSGGPLFNGWGEVVGLVLADARGVGEAVSIDTVLRVARAWNVRPSLKSPFVPRGGYRTRIGASLLVTTARAQERFPGGRVPSGRVTLAYDVLPALSIHVGGLRLAPRNMAVSALMLGIGARLTPGRIAFTPFLEAGFGRTEARFDIGGFLVQSADGGQYVPVWDRAEEDRIGAGGGLTIEVLAVPRTMFELVVGYWGFSTPEMPGIDERFIPAPTLPHVYLGGGVRIGL